MQSVVIGSTEGSAATAADAAAKAAEAKALAGTTVVVNDEGTKATVQRSADEAAALAAAEAAKKARPAWLDEKFKTPEELAAAYTELQKKLGVLIRINNELFRYASPAVDQMLKSDAAKTLALGFDFACLYGTGGAGQPKGLSKYTGTTELYDYTGASSSTPITPQPTGIGTNGNMLQPQDGFRMAGIVNARNFPLDGFGWIMHPLMMASILSRRADATTANDQAGQFVQSQFRTTADGLTANWDGFKISPSSQVRTNQVKGASGATLTEVWGGNWTEFLMGMYGAVEFAANPMGEATFIQDQTLVRGILHCDCVPRYPGAFAWYQQLVLQ